MQFSFDLQSLIPVRKALVSAKLHFWRAVSSMYFRTISKRSRSCEFNRLKTLPCIVQKTLSFICSLMLYLWFEAKKMHDGKDMLVHKCLQIAPHTTMWSSKCGCQAAKFSTSCVQFVHYPKQIKGLLLLDKVGLLALGKFCNKLYSWDLEWYYVLGFGPFSI